MGRHAGLPADRGENARLGEARDVVGDRQGTEGPSPSRVKPAPGCGHDSGGPDLRSAAGPAAGEAPRRRTLE